MTYHFISAFGVPDGCQSTAGCSMRLDTMAVGVHGTYL